MELPRRAHPAEVREPYQALIGAHLLVSYDKRRYARAITLPSRLREAYAATGESTRFDVHLEALRADHRRRPRFRAKIDAARFPSGR